MTVFKKIINREIPAEIVYEDESILAFKDVNPQAPVHILLIPKKEISSLNQLTLDDEKVIGHIHLVAVKIAKEMGLADKGYRLINNCGEDGGQTVHHLHFHLMGGRSLSWPPG